MNAQSRGMDLVSEGGYVRSASSDRKDFWSEANLNFSEPWYRVVKSARLLNKLASGQQCALLDVGCGPAALGQLLDANIDYHGIDIAIHRQAPNLIEADIVEQPISFRGKRFDLVIAQGIFEYVGDSQSQKFSEIAQLLADDGKFVATYWNFGHRKAFVYPPFSNVRPLAEFRADLARYFTIERAFPASHNWHHDEPKRKLIKAMNMQVSVNIPVISPMLAVEYYFICSPRQPAR